jgi:hypothetical protein
MELLAERRAGELLAKVERQQGKRKDAHGLRSTLQRSGIDPHTGHRWQTLVTIPEAEIRRLEAACNETHRELTSAALYLERSRQQRQEMRQAARQDLPALSGRYGVMSADPPER